MKNVPARPPPIVVAGLGLAIVLDTFIQITWKQAATAVPTGISAEATLERVLVNPWFIAAMFAFAAQLWNWVRVLSRADLSYAQPITALSYVTVLALSVSLLHERISVAQGWGVGLILLGVWFISRTSCQASGASGGDEPPRPVTSRP